MNALIFDIKKYSVNDGPGIRTTIFFKGCPLRCMWCHNPESQEDHREKMTLKHTMDGTVYEKIREVGKYMSVDEVTSEVLKDAVFYEESGGGVTFSGGEPSIQYEFLLALAKELKNRNIHIALDSCGYSSKMVFEELNRYIDTYLFDLKLIDENEHIKYTGYSNKSILENLRYLSQTKADIIIRIPIIPGITDTETNLKGIAFLIDELPEKVKEVHLLPFHQIGSNKYARLDKKNPMEGIRNLSREDVKKHITIFESKGFNVKIGG
jgi:pyruvate formate lyase activating enzyme